VVVRTGGPVPAAWAGAPRVLIDDATLTDPESAVTELHRHWLERRPVVVALTVDAARFRAPRAWPVEPWTVGARFEAWLDRLHFLVWANTYDARDGEPVW
jgi:hypothetical protein